MRLTEAPNDCEKPGLGARAFNVFSAGVVSQYVERTAYKYI